MIRQIGPLRLAITGDIPRVVDRFQTLFADFPEVDEAPSHVLALEPGAERDGPATFSAQLDGVVICRNRPVNDVELLVTRAINRQLLDGEPDWLHLHAGAVTNGTHTVLIVGESMSGKSTLVAKLVSNGWQYLTDESIGVRDIGELVSYPRPITVRRASWQFFDELAGLDLPDQATRVEVPASTLGHVYRGPAVTPTIVIRPDISIEQATVEALTSAQTTELLVTDSLDLERSGDAGLDAIIAIAEQAPSFRLGGRNLDTTCQTIASLCKTATAPGDVLDIEKSATSANSRRSPSATAWLFADRSAAIHDQATGVHALVDSDGFSAWRALGEPESQWPPQAAGSPFVQQLITSELLTPGVM